MVAFLSTWGRAPVCGGNASQVEPAAAWRRYRLTLRAPRARVARTSAREAHMIKGMHAMFYSRGGQALRDFIKEKLALPATDVGEGWLIFDAPEADLGVHPTEGDDPPSGTADISFYCDRIHETVEELKRKGVEFTEEIQD